MEELKAGSPAKENQPHGQQPHGQQPGGQQPQAKAATGVNPSTAPGPSKPVLAASRRNAQHSSAANRKAAMRQQLEVRSSACLYLVFNPEHVYIYEHIYSLNM